MNPTLQDTVEYLRSRGIEVEPQKSTFQNNVEMSAILLTFMMAEIDYLRAKIETLEGGA